MESRRVNDMPQQEARKSLDCREHPEAKGCTIKISGSENEVLDEAMRHAVSKHGFKETPEARETMRGYLKDEKEEALTGGRR
jgi:hypothetical protein